MEYTPTEFDDRVNVTRVHPLVNFGYLLGTVLVVGLAAFSGLGLLGAHLASNLGPETEAKIGAAMAEGVIEAAAEGEGDEGDESEGTDQRRDYLETLVQSFYGSGESPRLPLQVNILESDELNAFILPGGYIFVTDELLRRAESENELAFVLAHELGHFEARDNLKGLGRSLVFLTLSSLLNFGGSSAGAVGQAVSLGELSYSRSQESHADRFALEAVIGKYGHGSGSLDFFDKAIAETMGPELELFSTHPLSRKRIEAMEALAQAQGWKLNGETVPLPQNIACPNFEACD